MDRLRSFAAQPRTREFAVVVLAVVAMEALVFGGYFSGSVIPQFDFMSAYNTEAFAWWHDGGFFSPPQWMAYMWGGYPGVSNLQNSSYYLPFGITAAIVPLTLHAAAVLSALHAGFGAIGVYVFVRRWGAGPWAALLGLVGWFFAAGIYSNATQPDIARAYAWLPWLLLVTSIKWPWQRWYGVLLGLLVVWQGLLGIYPGAIVALAYLLPIWVIANQVVYRPKLRAYLLPLVIVGAAGAAMTLLRYLPAVLERGRISAVFPDQSEFGIATIGTFIYPFTNPVVPHFEVMRSFFLPAVILPLLVFIPWRSSIARIIAIITGVAVLLGLPFWPWHDLVTQVLPGMMLSRFRMSDFKVVILFGLVALAVFAVQSLLDRRSATEPESVPTWRRWVEVGALAAVALLFAVIGLRYGWDPVAALPQWTILAATCIIAWLLARSRQAMDGRRTVAVLALLGLVSGLIGVYATPGTWRADRVQAESDYFQGSVSDFIASRPADRSAEQRPGREPSPLDPQDPNEFYWSFGSVFYSGGSSVFGYVNLRGNETWELIKSKLFVGGQLGRDLAAFWAAPGLLISTPGGTMPATAEISGCADTGECGGGLTMTPVSYDPNGSFRYDLVADADTAVSANEAWYSGWTAQLCSADGTCTTVPTARGEYGQLTLEVPAGSWRLELDYRLPGQSIAWAAFWASIVAAASLAGVTELSRRRRRESRASS